MKGKEETKYSLKIPKNLSQITLAKYDQFNQS